MEKDIVVMPALRKTDQWSAIEVKQDIHAPWTWYIATFGAYDLDCKYGSGRTPLDAIVDLLDNTEG